MDPKHKMMHGAMSAVLEDMGRAAREGRARRFTPKSKPVEDLIGPHGEHLGNHLQKSDMDVEVDPVKKDTSPEEIDALLKDMEVEH